MSGNKKDTVDFHHYTDKESVKKIQKSGVILQSDESGGGDDAAFGPGAYGTTLTPDSGKKALAKNNYDDAGGLAQEKIARRKIGLRI
ncbi:hypothetical protein C0Q70_21530 [Pomacea canaliculata]|uniref:Uncharacterized protein n=1 Tax=Pomacea canaliculata TaxID=400727 RepID=A0A2T7NCS8_POMCA|nr:hypothetical protein C0Q70_21530 [Pomacea canaliculata]